MKRILSILLAVMMIVSLGSFVAFAADDDESAEPRIIKELNVADGINISNVNEFEFSFTAVGSDSAAVADHPTVADATIQVGTQENNLATGEKTLDSIFGSLTFPHAGVYVYNVAETTEAINVTENGITKKLTVDSTVYKVEVYVANTEEGGLEITTYVVYEGEEKKDPTSDGDDGFKFVNTYTEVIEEDQNGVLTVTKEITGTYADLTKTFPVTVTIILPEGLASAEDVVLAEGSKGTLSDLTVTADLTNGDAIKFSKLPAGATFTVAETQDTNYRSKVTGDLAEGEEDDDYTAYGVNVDKDGITITTSGNEVNIENNRDNITPPTGVIINNLPYILLVVIAGGALAFMALKKKAYKA